MELPFDEQDDLVAPVAFHKGNLVVFSIAQGVESPHHFGGRLPGVETTFRESVLHNLMTVDIRAARILPEEHGDAVPTNIPLIYAFRHDGCELEYSIHASGDVTVTNLSPQEPTLGWPYENYPKEFPQQSLLVSPPTPMSFEDFQSKCSMQELPDGADEAIVFVVPPSSEYDVSLWGEDGDAEMVQTICLVDPITWYTRAFNQCS